MTPTPEQLGILQDVENEIESAVGFLVDWHGSGPVGPHRQLEKLRRAKDKLFDVRMELTRATTPLPSSR